MYWINLFAILLFISRSQARDLNTVEFVKSFLENEEQPTFLVLTNLCWSQSIQLKLLRKLISIGVRSCSSDTLEPESRFQGHALLFLNDLDCPGSEELLLNTTLRKFRSPYRWLILSTKANETSLRDLWDSTLAADSDVVLAKNTEKRFTLTEVYKPSAAGPMYLSRGFYNGSLVDVRPHRELFSRRHDVMGHPLVMSNVIQDSNSTMYHLPKEDRLELEYDSISKSSWSNVKLAFEMLNSTPTYIFNSRFGYKSNGTWSDGMIRDLYTYKAHIGTGCLINFDRLGSVIYTDTLVEFRVKFIYRQPPLSYVSNIFSLPFSSRVWLALVICSVITTASLVIATRWESSIEKSPAQLDGSLGDALLLTMSAVSQQGCFIEPRKLPGRIILWFLFAALMALYAAYSANIVVLLQAPSNSIKTLAQLANSKMILGAVDVDYNHFVIKEQMNADPVRGVIYKKIEPEKGVHQYYSMDEGVQRIREGLFALHSIVQPIYRRIEQTFLETEKCDLTEVDFLNSFDAYMPMQKDSPYLELLRVAFKRLRESGLQSIVNKRLLVQKPRCANKRSAFASVGLIDIRPVLLLMLYGVCLAVGILIAEILISRLFVAKPPLVAR